MSLGALVTVVGTGIANLSIVVLDNGIYEVTGGQKTPATTAPVDLAEIARAAGFPSVARFRDLANWQMRAGEALRLPGPRFICLEVQPTPQEYLLGGTPPVADQLDRLRRALDTVP
jgi:thiamine pyrophosphate-dependent acetolactate synthase large subunit-like protein